MEIGGYAHVSYDDILCPCPYIAADTPEYYYARGHRPFFEAQYTAEGISIQAKGEAEKQINKERNMRETQQKRQKFMNGSAWAASSHWSCLSKALIGPFVVVAYAVSLAYFILSMSAFLPYEFLFLSWEE
jgi:hypothetical protein